MLCYFCKGFTAKMKAFEAEERRERVNDSEIYFGDPRAEDIKAAHALVATQPVEAFDRFSDLAEAGSAWGMLQVAKCYHLGVGTATSLTEAEHWYHRASAAGSDSAMLYAASFALARRDAAAVETILRSAVDNERTLAMRLLAKADLYVTKTPAARLRAKSLLERAYELGNLSAGFDLYIAMGKGYFGLRHIRRGVVAAYNVLGRMMPNDPVRETADELEGGALVSTPV